MTPVLIVLNAGSSSLKFQVYDMFDGAEPQLVWKGLYEGLGGSAHFLVKDTGCTVLDEVTWGSGDRFGHEALLRLVDDAHAAFTELVEQEIAANGQVAGPILANESGLIGRDQVLFFEMLGEGRRGHRGGDGEHAHLRGGEDAQVREGFEQR